MKFSTAFSLFIVMLGGSLTLASQPDTSTVPGTVVTHSPASSGIYIGSPGIVNLDGQTYLAKCDEFGPGSKEHRKAISRVYRSEDRGQTWKHVARIEGLFWASIFTHGDHVYLLGMGKHHGPIVIMQSQDQGDSWSEPTDSEHGLLTDQGEFHTAPVPLVRHQGRLWRAVEDAMGGTRWGARYRARMQSIPLDTDLLSQDHWTLSEPLASNSQWLNGEFGGWLEGNAVVTPSGQIVNILRVECPAGGKAAVVHVNQHGTQLDFDPERDIIDFPGGAKKFTIRFDETSQAYWTLVNPVMPRHDGQGRAGSIRNTLALMRSTDLRNWEIRCILLYHPDVRRHGFQYPDWLFDGKDIIATIRTAHDDGLGGAHNAHDANYLTFHRFQNFRDLTMADSVVHAKTLEAPPMDVVPLTGLTIQGRSFSLEPFGNEARAFSNRDYVWQEVPAEYGNWTVTQIGGGERARIEVTAQRDTTLYAATTLAWSKNHMPGWQPTEQTFCYTDANRTRMAILKREVRAGESLRLHQGSWAGTLLLLPPAAATSDQ